MRRDEVLMQIRELIRAYDDNIAPDECADQILAYLEDIKMEPPAVKETCETFYMDSNGQVMKGDDSFVFVNKWEK